CCVSPSASSVAVAGLTTTEPTACATDSTAVPDTPAVVAEIVATPFATAVARPVTGSMATTPAGDAHQANVCPGTTFPVAAVTTTEVMTCATESVAVPTTPAAVAVIVTEPGARPVASPVASTVAIAGSDELQVNVWPATGRPFPSSATAPYCCSKLTLASAADAGLTTTDLTICATASVAVPETPLAAAVIVAVPFPIAVTTPLGSTRATSVLSDVHANGCPEMTLPFASRAVAEKRC